MKNSYKQKMNVLTLNLCFKLPDDFKGRDLNEALEALIAYRKSKGKTHIINARVATVPTEKEAMITAKHYAIQWEAFLNALMKGYRICGGVALAKVNNFPPELITKPTKKR